MTEKISAPDFVKAWQKAETIAALVSKLGMSVVGARTRASNYRKAGIPLKKFAHAGRGNPLDIEALTALAKANGPTDEHVARKTQANKVSKKVK